MATPMLDLPCDEISKLYQSGQSISVIANNYKCDYVTIRRRLIKQNIKIRNYKESAKHGESSPFWKGESIGYRTFHHWLEHYFGKANHCEICHSPNKKKYEWANIKAHKYTRNREDYMQLCTECHRAVDLQKEVAI